MFPDGLIFNETSSIEFYESGTYIPLVLFSVSERVRESCISTVLNIVNNQTNVIGFHKKNVLDYFISELTNNVAEHSESTSGLLFVQSDQTKNFMDITIADNGIGIWASYNETDKFNPQNEAEAIEFAVNGRSTKDIPESRGFGLSGSRNMLVNGLNGKFCLWSGENIFWQTSQIKDILKVEKNAFFKGCFLNLRLPLNVTLKGNYWDYTG